MKLVLRVGSSFFLVPTLNTCPKPCLTRVLPCKHPCHNWDLGLEIPCDTNWPQMTWNLRFGTWNHVCHKSTSNDLGLRTWDPVWHKLTSNDLGLRAGLHYGGKSPLVMNSRGILKAIYLRNWNSLHPISTYKSKFDRSLRATLLTGGGLHYGQESFGGKHCTWMKNWHGCQRGGHFLGVLRRSSFLGNLKALDKKLDLRRTPTWIKYFIVFSSSRAYPPLPQITMSWAKLLHRPVHFSTLV